MYSWVLSVLQWGHRKSAHRTFPSQNGSPRTAPHSLPPTILTAVTLLALAIRGLNQTACGCSIWVLLASYSGLCTYFIPYPSHLSLLLRPVFWWFHKVFLHFTNST